MVSSAILRRTLPVTQPTQHDINLAELGPEVFSYETMTKLILARDEAWVDERI
jgi:hypothetical protein